MSTDTGIRLRGLDQFQAALRLAPKALERASRSAVDRTLTFARKQTVSEFYQGTSATKSSIKGAQLRRMLELKRTRQGSTEGRITASNQALPLMAYNAKPVNVTNSGTSARLRVQDEYGKGFRITTTAFLNPKARRSGRMRGARIRFGRGRYDLSTARGPSMSVQLEAIAPQIEGRVNSYLMNRFQESIRRELRR